MNACTRCLSHLHIRPPRSRASSVKQAHLRVLTQQPAPKLCLLSMLEGEVIWQKHEEHIRTCLPCVPAIEHWLHSDVAKIMALAEN